MLDEQKGPNNTMKVDAKKFREVIAIDPDTKKPGVAIFTDGGVLRIASAMPLEEAIASVFTEAQRGVLVVIECPQTYGGRASGGADANDLIALARVVGMFEQCALHEDATTWVVKPREWKGNIPKDITISRAWKLLAEYERQAVIVPPRYMRKLLNEEPAASGTGADVMDAVALGLWALGKKKTLT